MSLIPRELPQCQFELHTNLGLYYCIRDQHAENVWHLYEIDTEGIVAINTLLASTNKAVNTFFKSITNKTE